MGLMSLFSRQGYDEADDVLPEQTKDWFAGRLKRHGWKLHAACLPLLEWSARQEGSPELIVGYDFTDLSGLLLHTLAVTGGSDDRAVVVLTRIRPPRFMVEAAASKSILLIRYDGIPELPDRVRAMKAMLLEERRAAHEANEHVPVGFTEADIEAQVPPDEAPIEAPAAEAPAAEAPADVPPPHAPDQATPESQP